MARRKGVLLASVVALGLAACGGEPEEQAADVARLVKSVVVGGSNAAGTRQFPGKVEAYRQADIGFRIDGKVTTIEVKEGEQVAENQLLARLDQTDLRITLKDRQATYDANNANYLRGKELVAEGAISRMDFDKLEAAFKTADAALEQARQNIAYTELRAPFAGNISRRLVERFEEVQAKQPVFELRDVSRLEVKFDVPENLVIGMRSARKDDAPIPVYAVFESLPQVQFPLQIKEVATSADPKTQTFEVTMSMPRPEQLNLLPGMTTMVTVDFARRMDVAEVFMLPASAVLGDNNLQASVWVVDSDSMAVTRRQVTVGAMRGNSVEITSGLQGGERVVTAGAGYLIEGMKVRLMPDVEQADPATSPVANPS